jgi:hypothetical protein
MGEMERETIDRTYIVYAPPYQNPLPKGHPHLWISAHESVGSGTLTLGGYHEIMERDATPRSIAKTPIR